jgi:hypothetical protein
MVMTVVVEMLMGVGMLVVVSMGMLVGMGMGDTVMGVLVGMFMGMLMGMAAHMVVMDMHSNSSFAFFYIIPLQSLLVKTFIFWKSSPVGACFVGENPL